jgi:hypothetical protein
MLREFPRPDGVHGLGGNKRVTEVALIQYMET